ncbi:hypothetical protein TcasGA2_TC007606 [Tribolium castaneum]|uniref:Uncharacterized protein n=1 Tax=Tribolium castaneum TaxID=7070 RepID=D2A2Y0_TRICA|nr:hypothetical protein TcasGA2_TC007606 [Tribolium castaneum]
MSTFYTLIELLSKLNSSFYECRRGIIYRSTHGRRFSIIARVVTQIYNPRLLRIWFFAGKKPEGLKAVIAAFSDWRKIGGGEAKARTAYECLARRSYCLKSGFLSASSIIDILLRDVWLINCAFPSENRHDKDESFN